MTDKTNRGGDVDRDEETMERLLRLAGPRPPIPDDVEQRVYDRVYSEWATSTRAPEGERVYAKVHRDWSRRRAVRRWAVPVALAASLIFAVTLLVRPPPPASRLPVGTVAKIVGGPASGVPAIGGTVYAGDRLTTGDGQGLSLALYNAGSLRLDADTVLVVDANNRFRLEAGRIYADTGDFVYPEHELVIETQLGDVTDVGTQFSVQIIAGGLDIAVREGRVDVQNGQVEATAVAGEYLKLRQDGAADIEALDPYDSYWDFAQALAPAFEIEDKSLLEFLRWAARESGRELVFENDELRMAAMRIDLHGSVADFKPLDAVQSVLAGTRFRYRIEPQRIVIEE